MPAAAVMPATMMPAVMAAASVPAAMRRCFVGRQHRHAEHRRYHTDHKLMHSSPSNFFCMRFISKKTIAGLTIK
jgi:hypothetical protein